MIHCLLTELYLYWIRFVALLSSGGGLLRQGILPFSFDKFLTATVELQWLEHLWNHENTFATGVVRADECESQPQVRRQNRDIYYRFSLI